MLTGAARANCESPEGRLHFSAVPPLSQPPHAGMAMDIDNPSPRLVGGGAEPPRIRRLEESVVNRIAAGEVIQRPSAAVKELMENSLDAGASTISVTVKDGGLKLIQVSDDGHGIRFEDLPILCERHTTSKLSEYEDLQTIKSMGFRGEALASMTYVGHVTVTTITEGQLHGYRVSYKDGVMENEPKPCAAVKGTQVMVENLFYNMVARRKTLQNSNDDYPKIVDFISRFAIHHINVTFSCRKHGANRADVHSSSTSSRLDAIRNVYGASVVRDLMEIEVSDENNSETVFKMNGYISNANYLAKKITMILFINDRLVDCTALKRAIEFVYSATVPQASKPFIYMSINLPSEHVDVNIHPTKKEVSLLNQERIIEVIKNAIEEKLRNSNSTRIFQTQAINSLALTPAITQKEKAAEVKMTSGTKSQKPPSQMVRTDPRNPSGRLHTYWHGQSSNLEKKSDLVSVRNVVRSRRNPKDAGDLSSRHELLMEIEAHCHPGLLNVVKNCTYVGLADEVFALIQHNTRLYLVNVVNVSKELMYQQALCRFGNFNAIQLSEPALLRELLMMALKDDEMVDENDAEKQEIAEVNSEILKENAEMINEYFSIHIDKDGNLTRLPVVLDQYTPDLDRLPEFVLSMGNDVTWDDEKECFRTAAAAIGNFYALHPPILPNPSGSGIQLYKKNKNSMASGDHVDNTEDDIDQELLAEAETAWSQREWTIQHVLFPSIRLFLKPPKSMATDGTFVQVHVRHGDNVETGFLGQYDLDHNVACICDGGPLFGFDGKFAGMNLLLARRYVYNKDRYGNLESLGYPALPESKSNDGMILVNNFEDHFGDKYGEGVWSELSETVSSNINENIVALASFRGWHWTGGPLLEFDGKFVGMNFYDEIVGTPYLYWSEILAVLDNFKTKRTVADGGYDGKASHALDWTMDKDKSANPARPAVAAAGDDGEASARPFRLALHVGVLPLRIPLHLLRLRLVPLALAVPLPLLVVLAIPEPLSPRSQAQDIILCASPLQLIAFSYGKESPSSESVVLHIEHLSRNVNEAHLKEIFANYGEVVNVELAMDRLVNLPRGYGYIEFKNKADAEKALLYMNGGQIDGNVVKLKFNPLQPRQRALSPVKAPPPPPKRGVPQNDKGASIVEKDTQQRPRESSPRRKPASPPRKRSPNRRVESPRRPPDPSPRRRPDSPPVRRRADPSPVRRGDTPPRRRPLSPSFTQEGSRQPISTQTLTWPSETAGSRTSIEAWKFRFVIFSLTYSTTKKGAKKGIKEPQP
ncbi:hypothetical protein EJB05_18848, partial [Eragrostis curvula]